MAKNLRILLVAIANQYPKTILYEIQYGILVKTNKKNKRIKKREINVNVLYVSLSIMTQETVLRRIKKMMFVLIWKMKMIHW